MCNYREIGVIKADLMENQARIGDSRYTEEEKLTFSKISGELMTELRRERDRLHQRKTRGL